MIATKEGLQNYLEAFEQFEKRAAGSDHSWLRKLRRDAFARFWEVGFPTLRDEDWRFTNVSALTNGDFVLAQPASVHIDVVEPLIPPNVNRRIVFVNGRFAPELSRTGLDDGTVSIISLRKAIESHSELLEKHLAQYEDVNGEAFTALNTAFIEDGAFVHIARGSVIEDPIYILYISTGNTTQMVFPRNLIVAEAQTQATIVEDYVSLASGSFFSNVVTELVASEDSVLSHYMIEREDTDAINVSTLRLQQRRNANVDSHSILVGGALVRNNVHPVLVGEGAECLINGLFVANGSQHMDNYMKVEHASPHCSSRQFYNGILDGKSRGVFHGRIIVHKDAQKTDAKQTNRNLLLSDDAQIDTKPQLEIYADDVKCTHGATIGQIAEEALFYMRSRGLPESAARRLLLFAFASECLDRMRLGPIRQWLETALPQWLPKTAAPGSGK